jgi:glycosyltransferase involved in cell wall biosynthesis
MPVSVVIPAYNSENWIAETLASVSNQTYRALEVIVVDDGSRDRTREVAASALAHGPFPYRILSQANAGAAEARNTGWRAASGEFVQFLDADDLLAPEKIETQMTSSVDGADVLYSDWQKLIWTNGSWATSDPRSPQIKTDPLADILSDRNFLQLSSLLFRKSMLSQVGGFDTSHEPIEDVGLCVKIAIAGGRFVKVPSVAPLSLYRDLPRSFSKVNRIRFIESCVKNAKLAERYIQDRPQNTSRVIDAIVDVYFAGARFFAGVDWRRFEELVSDIEVLNPHFLPKAPAHLAALSKILGYRKAERIAVIYRQGKSAGARLLRRTNRNLD